MGLESLQVNDYWRVHDLTFVIFSWLLEPPVSFPRSSDVSCDYSRRRRGHTPGFCPYKRCMSCAFTPFAPSIMELPHFVIFPSSAVQLFVQHSFAAIFLSAFVTSALFIHRWIFPLGKYNREVTDSLLNFKQTEKSLLFTHEEELGLDSFYFRRVGTKVCPLWLRWFCSMHLIVNEIYGLKVVRFRVILWFNSRKINERHWLLRY